MESISPLKIQNRKQAGYLLAQKLGEYKDTNTVVVGIPYGGVDVASAIAESLQLPLEIMICRKIKDPADSSKEIGMISESETFMHEISHDIPRDFISHQIALLQNEIKSDREHFYGNVAPTELRYKTVIIADDILASGHSMLICLESIRKHKPLKVIVAAPIVSAEAASAISGQADEFIFLKMTSAIPSGGDYFIDFHKMNKEEVHEVLAESRSKQKLVGSGVVK
ncbi:MAG TPA: phosphoribosyltransferase family protein [Cyclobacteriaceae bacterium]|nr:phosphoribosyltransferase family protein [Cyclobacteriaceae bacterium]